jgi:hypothetical protein
VEEQVRAYFDVQLRVTMVPTGTKSGSVPLLLLTDLQQRVVDELPTVMVGEELTSQTRGFLDYIAALSKLDSAIVVTGGGVDRIEFDGPAVLSENTAAIGGTYDCHSDSYHYESGMQIADSFRETRSFTAQLTRVNGTWLVSSVTTTLLSQAP